MLYRSGTTADLNSGVYSLSGLTGYGAVTNNDVPIMSINRTTGQVDLVSGYSDVWPLIGTATQRGTFQSLPFTVKARVQLSTDSVSTTFQIDYNTISKDIVLFRNPSE